MPPRPLPARFRALARLLRRGEVRALARVVRRLGSEAWIVGGAVRDACLGLPVLEIDVAVAGDAESIARALEAEGAGRAVFLSRDRPGPRVFRVAGSRPLDIAELEGGSIETDLGRRDFTVNAIAVAVAGRAPEIVDPFGGLEDLARRRLRPVRAENLAEDPLRALRAARFLATHGLAPDRATLAAARAAAPRLAGVAAERVGGELERILGSRLAAPALAWAARAGLLSAALDTPLPGRRSAILVRSLAALDDGATRRLPENRRRRLRLALLALSLGLAGRDARAWSSRRRLPRREAEDAARLVDLVHSAAAVRPRDRRAAWRWVLDAGPLAADAVHLLARRRQTGLAARLSRLARRKPRPVAVNGQDVLRWLEIPAGPQVGALLRDLAVAVACGDVKNRRQARHWLTGQVREGRAPAIISSH